MKAISVQRPWSELIVASKKRIENRGFVPALDRLYPGTVIAIHASKKEDHAAWSVIHTIVADVGDIPNPSAPSGAFVGLAVYCGLDPTAVGRDPYACGPRCWRLELGCRVTEPYPYKGKLGCWDVGIDASAWLLNNADPESVLGAYLRRQDRRLTIPRATLAELGIECEDAL